MAYAREWIFGDALREKSRPCPVIELKQNSDASAFSLAPAQIAEAAACFRRLAGLASLNEAVSYFLKHANPSGGRRTVAQVSAEFIKSRKAMGVRSRMLIQYESYLRMIGEYFGEQRANEVKRSEIENWLSESDWSK